MAATLVVIAHGTHILATHYPKAFGEFWQFGRAGVEFFFVLSGFIITFVHLGDFGNPQLFLSFWVKRLLRIFPIYWIASALIMALFLLSPTQSRPERELLHIVFSALLLPEMARPILDVGWTLRHELLFYAFFSVTILQRSIGTALLTLWGVGIAWNLLVQTMSGTPYFTGLANHIVFRGFNIEFFFGIAAALVIRSGWVRHPHLLTIVGALGFCATGMYESYGHQPMLEWPIRQLGYAISATLIICGIATLDLSHRTRVPKFALRVGAASYSIYLIHLPILLVLEIGIRGVRSIIPIPSEVIAVIGISITVISGVIFSEVVEQPLLRYGRRAYGEKISDPVRTRTNFD